MCINLDQLVGVVGSAEAAFTDPAMFKSIPPEVVEALSTTDDDDEDDEDNDDTIENNINEDEDPDAEGEDEEPGLDIDAGGEDDEEEKWSATSTPSNISEYRPSLSPPLASDANTGMHDNHKLSHYRYHPYATIDRKTCSPPTRKRSDGYASSRSTAASASSTIGNGIPIPVPNLTKKSRGRKVPTTTTITTLDPLQSDSEYPPNSRRGRGRTRKSGPGLGPGKAPSSTSRRDVNRTYRCQVEECGKCFVRGEHLKRHIRSIHTNEKRELSLSSFSFLFKFYRFVVVISTPLSLRRLR